MTTPPIYELIRSSRTVDLTLTLSEDLPCWWPTAFPYRHTTDHWFTRVERDGSSPLLSRSGAAYHSCVVSMDEHTGTHFDAPSHFIPPPGSELPDAGPAGAITADRVELQQLMGPAVVIDVRSGVGPGEPGKSAPIEPSLITGWEKEHGDIGPGDVVLFRTDWDDHYVTGAQGRQYVQRPLVLADTPAWPAPSVASIELLHARGVMCTGTDAASMGPAEDGRPAHVAGLSTGMVFIECLCNLRELPARGATFVFLPLKIGGGSGGPGRALAFV
jgi:isatin hydrolase